MTAPSPAASKGSQVEISGSETLNSTAFPFPEYRYIDRVKHLQNDYPALQAFLNKIGNTNDDGRQAVEAEFNKHNRTPARCCVLEYGDKQVEAQDLKSPQELRDYLAKTPDTIQPQRRLFVLEDMELEYVAILGDSLGVDPLVFAEQMNTWNYCDVHSIAHRPLPSLTRPDKSFTSRYYELRTLPKDQGLDLLGCYMTFAANRRLYQPWRDIDVPSMPSDRRVGFIRRCYSFWTSDATGKDKGWDSLLLVDPPTDSIRIDSDTKSDQDPISLSKPQKHLILKDPQTYTSRSKLWTAKPGTGGRLKRDEHTSYAYHGGVPAAAALSFDANELERLQRRENHRHRNRASLFDEIKFSWTQIAEPKLIKDAREHPVNATFFMTKHIGYHWINLLELISFALAQCEYFADDNEAQVDSHLSAHAWKEQLKQVTKTAKDMNYFRRQMVHFENVLNLNLERLGVNLNQPNESPDLPAVLRDVQKDFLIIAPRLRSYRERIDNLSGIPDQLASVHAAFKGIDDGALGLRLSVFAAIVFPITLVAAVLSMGDNYLPGKSNFWVFWAASIPLSLVFGLFLRFGEPLIRLIQPLFVSPSKRSAARKNG